MRRFLPLLGLFVATALAAESPIVYRVSFPGYRHHEAEVELRLQDLDGPIEIRMARTSPGRYRLHEFARNVYAVSAEDGQGRAIELERPDPSGWIAAGHDGRLVFRYTVYGDLVSGTYSAIDETHAHLNPPSVFARPIGLDRAAEVHLTAPEPDWRIATQLEPTADPTVFRAPTLDYLLDSPIEISDFVDRDWRQGKSPQRFRMAVHHTGTDAEIDGYVEMARKVVGEAEGVFGELPRFDFGTYTFLVDYLPWAGNDAMEHRNSTPLVSRATLEESALELLETLSHEFFHAWNVERIRPAGLEPFDFDGTIHSDALWFAEGFTNYYDGLLIRRAGLWDDARFAEDLTATVDRLVRSSAPTFGSPIDMSRQAAFRDRAVWVDPQNDGNTFLSYYNYGEAIGLALDLEMRRDCGGSLDDLMQSAWNRFGVGEAAYRLEDIEELLGGVCGGERAARFFADHIRGRRVPDFGPLLALAGFELGRRHPGQAWAGRVALTYGSDGARVTAPTEIGSPLYEAGIDSGDTLEAVDGRRLRREKSWERTLERATPGDRLEVEVRGRGGMRSTTVIPIEDPRLVVRDAEDPAQTLTPAQRAFRADWLASRARPDR